MSTQNVYDVGSNGSVFASEQSYTNLLIIDAENLINREIKIDFEEIDNILKRYSMYNNTIKYAIVKTDINNKHSGLLKALAHFNYSIITTNNNTDVVITNVIFQHLAKYKAKYLFIITRDADFSYTINTIKQLYNIKVILLTTIANKFNHKLASQLISSVDHVIYIKNLMLDLKQSEIAKMHELQQLAKRIKAMYNKQQINMLISYLLS